MIPFVDLKKQHENLRQEIADAINKVIYNNSHFILGKELGAFEREFAAYCSKSYGIGVGNGTDALELSLRALNVLGKEVIIPDNTAIPTAMAVIGAGAIPILSDVKEDYLIDINEIEKKITANTKAIIPVHLYGQACDMNSILQLAKARNIHVVEDCCQAHGAEYNGKKVPIGDIGCFSFYPSKNLGALGDGGMIVTNNSTLDEKLRRLRNYGQSDKYHAIEIGVNTRLDELQAAILRAKLKHLDSFNTLREERASLYDSYLKGIVKIPIRTANKHIFHLYVPRVERRDELMAFLNEKQIGTLIHYPIPMHLQEAFKYLDYQSESFRNSERFSKEIISLPMFPELPLEDVIEVASQIKRFYGK